MTRTDRLPTLIALLGIACGLAFGARAQEWRPIPATVEIVNTPEPSLCDICDQPGVEADIRARLLTGEACESARLACQEHVDDLRLAALAADDVIATLNARVAAQDTEIARLRTDLARAEKVAMKRPKALPKVALGFALGAGMAVAVYEVDP